MRGALTQAMSHGTLQQKLVMYCMGTNITKKKFFFNDQKVGGKRQGDVENQPRIWQMSSLCHL